MASCFSSPENTPFSSLPDKNVARLGPRAASSRAHQIPTCFPCRHLLQSQTDGKLRLSGSSSLHASAGWGRFFCNTLFAGSLAMKPHNSGHTLFGLPAGRLPKPGLCWGFLFRSPSGGRGAQIQGGCLPGEMSSPLTLCGWRPVPASFSAQPFLVAHASEYREPSSAAAFGHRLNHLDPAPFILTHLPDSPPPFSLQSKPFPSSSSVPLGNPADLPLPPSSLCPFSS